MTVEPQISFRHMTASPALEEQITRRVAELETHCDRIIACRVIVELASRHGRQGNLFHVTVELSVPGGTIVADRDAGKDHGHEDAHVAVRDAFDAARRRLQDHMRRLEGEVKTHARP